jgi:hypothetical protein
MPAGFYPPEGVGTKMFALIKKKKQSADKYDIRNLPAGGRSSKDVDTFSNTLSTLAGFYDTLNPYVPIEVIEYLTLLAVVNPDVSQCVKNFQNIGNSGHRLIIQDKKDVTVEAALERLNKKAQSFYTISAGIDGLINHYFNQLSISGAISTEFVLQKDFLGVDRVVIVPTFSVRFKREEGMYKPYQRVNILDSSYPDGLIPLNDVTYTYYAQSVMGNSPYAIPPFTPVLEPAAMQKEMVKNIKFLMQKVGIVGFLNIVVKLLQPKPQGETEEQYRRRMQEYIDEIANIAKDNFSNGILVTPEDQELKFNSVTSDARGVKEIFQLNEEQFFSGLGIDPAMMGRSYSTTETYSGVVYEILLKSMGNMRRLIKRTIEKLYYLDLGLAGIEVENIAIHWNPDKRLNPNVEALAEKYTVETILKKLLHGAISPEQAAQELGYQDWYDLELMKQKAEQGKDTQLFKWSSQLQKYIPIDEAISIGGKKYMLVSAESKAKLKDEDKATAEAEEVEKKLQTNIETYLNAVLPYFDELKSDVTQFALDYTKSHIDEISKDPSSLLGAVIEYVNSHDTYKKIQDKESWMRKTSEIHTKKVGKDYFENDLTVFNNQDVDFEFRFGEGDIEAMKFYAQVDNFYFSKFIDNENFGGQINQFINRFLERGEALFGQWTENVEKEFLRLFGSALDEDFRIQMERIINTSMARIRTYSHIEQLFQAGFIYAEIDGVLDTACDICRPFHGKRVLVKTVRALIQDFVNLKSMEAAKEWIENTNVTKDDLDSSIEDLLDSGRGFPQFHVGCKCFVRGVFQND